MIMKGQQFDTIDEAMEAKVFDGKSLVDIWDEIFSTSIIIIKLNVIKDCYRMLKI